MGALPPVPVPSAACKRIPDLSNFIIAVFCLKIHLFSITIPLLLQTPAYCGILYSCYGILLSFCLLHL